jgi:hypothetical protein
MRFPVNQARLVGLLKSLLLSGEAPAQLLIVRKTSAAPSQQM